MTNTREVSMHSREELQPRPSAAAGAEVERIAVYVAAQWFGPNKYRDAWDDHHRSEWVRVFREAEARFAAPAPVVPVVTEAMAQRAGEYLARLMYGPNYGTSPVFSAHAAWVAEGRKLLTDALPAASEVRG